MKVLKTVFRIFWRDYQIALFLEGGAILICVVMDLIVNGALGITFIATAAFALFDLIPFSWSVKDAKTAILKANRALHIE